MEFYYNVEVNHINACIGIEVGYHIFIKKMTCFILILRDIAKI